MKLYYLPGASSLFPHIVLVETGLAFDAVKVDEHTKIFGGGGDYRSINPLGYVPALQLEDGTVLTETVAIAQYICDRVPTKDLAPPNGTFERAKLQSWLNFISSELQLGCFCPLFDREIPDAVKTTFRRRLDSRLA
jgi:glutathione S-transferase